MLEENSRLSRIMSRRRFGMRPGLESIRTVLAALGNPQDALRFIHVAGTNGKGATCALIDEVLRAAGYRVGRYTSPHLVTLNERFFLDGAPADDAALDAAAAKVLDVVEELERTRGLEVTFFETLTAVAFVFYAAAKPDVVVLETGLGGRFDATNVVTTTLLAVITRIGLDHCDWLGTTHAAIAEEKAGILKAGRPVVCAAMPVAARAVVARVAAEKGCPFVSAENEASCAWRAPFMFAARGAHSLPPIRFALVGAYQLENATTALAALAALERYVNFTIPEQAIVAGFERVVWPGRCQRIEHAGVTIYVDGAHNPDGATALVGALRELGVERQGPIGLVAGYCGDKDVLGHLQIVKALAARAWATPIRNARSLAPEQTAAQMRRAGFAKVEACGDFPMALSRALAWAKKARGTLVICGSLFLVAEALVALEAFPWPIRTPDANEQSLH